VHHLEALTLPSCTITDGLTSAALKLLFTPVALMPAAISAGKFRVLSGG